MALAKDLAPGMMIDELEVSEGEMMAVWGATANGAQLNRWMKPLRREKKQVVLLTHCEEGRQAEGRAESLAGPGFPSRPGR